MTFRQINLSAVNTSISSMTDPLIAINSGATGTNTKDLGMIFGRGSDTNVALLWDESTDQFAFINTDEAGLTAGDVTISSYSDLKVNDLIADNVTGATVVATTGFTGNLTGNVVGSTTGINYGNVTSTVGTSTFNNITMAGNLIVNGSTTTVSSTNTTLTDNLIELNTGAGSNDADSGIIIERGTTGDNAFMGWDESSDSFILGTTTATGASIGNLTITPTALQLGSLDITDTTAGSDAGPIVTLHRDITGADANYIGQIKFTADNDANQSTVFAKITGKIDDASDGTEDGIIEIAHKKAGSNNISARFTSTDLKLINGTGLEVAGETTLESHLNMGDNDTIKLGDADDYQIYHDGGNSYLKNNTGWLNMPMGGSGVSIANSDFTESIAKFIKDGACELYHNGSKKIETTASGVTMYEDTAATYTTTIQNTADNLQLLLGTTSGSLLNIQGKTINSNATYQIALQAEGGNVGIGTSSPVAPISVLGPTSNTLQATISGGSGGTSRGLHISTATTGQSSNDIVIFDCPISTGTLSFNTNSTERMRIDSSGNVGIGTSSPSDKLHLQKSSDNGVVIENTTGATLSLLSTGAGRVRSSGHLIFDTGGSTEHMRIDSSGNVGIGSTSPSAKLTVEGTLAVRSSSSQYFNDSSNANNLTMTDSKAHFNFDGTDKDFQVSSDNLSHALFVQGSDGNVGIGTSTPSSTLHVVGSILASGDVTAYSDERLKDNIQTIDGALGKVNSMRGVTYTKDGLESSGVIAQEIEKIAPELVKDGEYKSVAYGNLVGYLIEAIKEQQIQIEQSKIEIDNLKKLIGE